MGTSFEEKRSTPRTYFNNGEKIAAAINGTGGEPYYVDVLNISAGGLQFSQKREEAIPMKPGDEVTLVGLNGLAELRGIKEVRMEIRWVIDENAQDKIQRLVAARAEL